MYHFTPAAALLGGLLIGLSATLLWSLNGRIAGITGILANALENQDDDAAWRGLFLLGLVLGASAYEGLSGTAAEQLRHGFPWWLLLLSGVLTGYGTSLANGCTSGHGVCGLGRFSVRSLVATVTFLGVGIVTVYVFRHVLVGVT
jgi:uncharacterized membrane protein YedE/YeeE